ncbi:MAG: hypothetical protein J3Q66DRAFT_385574 [Benniella sp.]|nr:MAG: hypothetical protein J3Q66DRAFT_385574 [Benniella sp.]
MKHKLWAKVSRDEIQSMQTTNYNVKAPGQILQQIDVRMFAPTAHIIAVDVSASGEYITILSADKYNAYVAIWDMDAVLRSPPAQINKEHNPYQHSFIRSEPIASTTISLQRFDRIIIHRVRIAISSDGLRVVLYHQPHDDDLAQPDATRKSSPFPFIYIQVKDTYVTAKDLHNTTHVRTMEMTEDITIHCPNNQFIGFGKFMSSDSFGTNSEVSGDADTPKVEYFVACDQSRIAVYDVDNGWKPLYGIAIGGLYSMKSRVDQLRILHQNLQGPSFVWMEDLQNVSIWDIVSGTNLRYISVHNPHSQSQDEIEYIAVSPGGKLMALAGKDWIRTYFMDSGIEIGTKVIDDGTVLDIKFLDCNNGLVVTIRNPSMDQISIILDAMNLSSWNSSPSVFHSSSYSIQHIARPSQATMEAHVIGGVMMTVNHNVLEMFAIPQPGVSIPGGPLIGCRDTCATMKYQGLDSYIHHHPVSHSQYYLAVGFEERESGNQRYKLACVRLHSVDKQGQKHDIITIVPEPWRMLDVDEESAGVYVEASFIDRWPQFIVITPMGFQVWNLPSISTDNRCEMALSWVTPSTDSAVVSDEVYSYAEKIQDTRVCVHGESVRTTWFDIRKAMNMSECIRIPKRNWITKTETRHCIESIPVLASCYTESSVSAKEAIVRYIVKHINHDPPEGTLDDSVMAKIARSARLECCYDILDAVLRSTDGQWIPRCSSISLGKPRTRVPANPIMLLVKDAKNVPLGLPMAERLIDYCIRQAKSQCDPAFVLPVLLCLRDQVLIRSNTNLSVNPSYAEMIPAAVRRALSLYGGRTVRANFSDLDYFDNPAVEALIQHKWNSVVWKTWMVKRVFLVIYFTLVLTVTTMQVYPIMRIEDLQGYLYAIIPMGLFFLYLEFRQFLTDKWSYITSPYNLVDVVVFVLAPLGCVQLLVSISKYENTDAPGYSRALSYVITGIYIQLTGRYNPVDTEFGEGPGGNRDLRLSIKLYYAAVPVYGVSMFIAIMNVAIVEAAYYGPLAWLSHRFCAVTSAERLSLATWRFREQSDIFPQYVYYKVPESEAEEFEKRHPSSSNRGKTLSLPMDGCNYTKDRASALEVPIPTVQHGSETMLQKPQGQENTIPNKISVDTRSKVGSPLSYDDRSGGGVVDWPGVTGSIGSHIGGSVNNDDDDSGCNDTGDDQGNGMSCPRRKLREALHIAQETVRRREMKMDRMTELLVQQQLQLQRRLQQLDQLQQRLLTQRGMLAN